MRAYHGTSTAVIQDGEHVLRPPCVTGILQEHGRRRNLDRVFATPDPGLARIYAGRAVSRFGGRPVLLTVSLPDRDTETLSDRPGATVLAASGAWIIERQTL